MCEVRGEWGDMSSAIKIVVPPVKKENLSWRDAKTTPSVKYRSSIHFLDPLILGGVADKHRQKFKYFYTCSLWAWTAAIFSSISYPLILGGSRISIVKSLMFL